MGGSSKKVTVGYKYYMGMHMVLSHGPVDALTRIRVDGRDLWVGRSTGGQITIDRPGLFGGESREGGISGALDFEMGGPSQTPNDYLVAQVGDSHVPAFRRVVGIILRQMYLGMNPYLKRWSFRLQRIHTRQDGLEQWYDAKAEVRSPEAKSAPAVSFLEDFSGGMSDYILEQGDASRFVIVNDTYGLCLKMNAVTSSIVTSRYRDIPGSETTQVRFKFKLNSAGADDGGVMELRTVGGTSSVLAFNSMREARYDPLRRALLVLQGVGDIYMSDAAIDLGVWYQVEVTTGAAGAATATMRVAGTGTVVKSVVLGAAFSPSNIGRIRFIDDPHTGGGSTSWADIELKTGGIQRDMNPAHIIRECLTDPDWGMGYAEADVDDTSFVLAADTLYAEGMGMSLLWDRQMPIEDFVKEVVKHINAVLFIDRSTGKFVLKLIRDDYVKEDLLLLDESNIERVEGFSRPSAGELVNSVTVSYWDAVTGRTSTLTVQDIALVQMQGAVINTAVQYPGFTNAYIATRAAMRDLKILSTPLLSCTIIANRVASQLTIGAAFRFAWPAFFDGEIIMRVTGLAFGNGRTNKIKVTCTQDVFDLPEAALVAQPDAPTWTDPSAMPSPAELRAAIEMPYFELVQRSGQSAVDDELAINPEAGYIGVAAARPGPSEINATLKVDSGTGFEDVATLDFCPAAKLSASVTKMDTTLSLQSGVDLESISVGTYALLGGVELVSVETYDSGTSVLTVKRGVLDTVPHMHLAGTTILFLDAYLESDNTQYVLSDEVSTKVLPVSGGGVLEEGAAPTDTVTFSQRAFRPYPPADFKVEGLYFPEAIPLGAHLDVSWAHRDRRQQTAGFIGFSEGSIGPEAGTTYTLRIYGENDVLGRTYAGLTGTSVSYDIEDEKTDFALPGSGGLVGDAYWTDVKLLLHMNGADGSVTFTDSSAVARVLTVNGAVAIDVDQSQFDGASGLFPADDNGFLTAANSADFNFGSGDFTVEMWVRPSTATGRLQFILGTRPPSGGDRGWVMTIGSAGTLGFAGWGSSGATIVNISGGLMVAGTWQHVAVTRSGSTFRLFRDGTLVATDSTAAAIGDSTAVLRFSGDPTTSGRYYAGHIDEVRITKGVARYVADFSVPTSAFPESGLVPTAGYRPNGLLRLELEAVRDGVVSLQKQEHTVVRYGYGFQYGKYFGGV